MQTINQDDPHENGIRMLFLHALFMPVEKKMAEAKAELVRMVWEDPSGVERVVLAYSKAILGIRGMRLGSYEKTDGMPPGMALDGEQEKKVLMLIKELRQEAMEARLGRVKDRKEISWARMHGRETGTRVSIRVH